MRDLLKLWPYIRPYRGILIIAYLLGILMSVSIASVTKVVDLLFNDVFVTKDALMAIIVPAAIPMIYIVHGVSRFFHMYIMRYTSDRVITQIQSSLQDKYMALSLSYYGKNETSRLISKIIYDVRVVQEGFHFLAILVREPITVICLLAVLIYYDWQLTIYILAVGPVLIYFLNIFSKSVRKKSYSEQETMEKVTAAMKETVDGIRIIQSFNLRREMKKRFQSFLNKNLSLRRKIIKRQEASGPISEIITASVIGLVLFYKGQQILDGTSNLGHFMAYFAALSLIQPSVKKLQESIVKLQPTVSATNRIFNVLTAKDHVHEVLHPQPFPSSWDYIKFKNLSFLYEKFLVLKNINLKVSRGEVVALVGESGSGKSTLVNLMERFYEPTEGSISIGSVDISEMELQSLRQNIALVTQDVFLFNDTIRKNIAIGNKRGRNITVEQAAKLANAEVFIKKLGGYETGVGDLGGRLSGGEKQRISIARALYKDAPILLLDEATSALDSASEIEVQKGLDHLMKGRTVFIIAHRLSTVVKADRILVFKEGLIVEEGTHDELLRKKGHYFRFHEFQTQL